MISHDKTNSSAVYSPIGVEDVESGWKLKAKTMNEASDSSEDLSQSIDEIENNNDSEDNLDFLKSDSAWIHLQFMITRAVPVMGSFIVSYLINILMMIYASHYGFESGNSDILAGVTLSNLFGNVTVFSLLIGLSSSVETLASQNFGARNFEEVGIILQRCILILGALSIPLLLSWIFVGSFYSYCGVDPKVVAVITNLLRTRAFSMPAEVFNTGYEKYLAAIGVTTPTLYCTISCNVSIFVLLYIFVAYLKLPYMWLEIAHVMAVYIGAITHYFTSLQHRSVQITLRPWDKRALQQWWEFLKLGIPGAAMTCSEWWAYEILTLMASRLGTASVAAQSLMLQVLALAFMVPLGLSIATASLIGNAIGAQQKDLAIRMGKMSLGMIFVLDFFISGTIFVSGNAFVHFLSNDPDVIRIFLSMLPLLCIVPFADGVNCLCSGIMRGTGKQFLGAISNIFSYYGIGLPCAWFFCFRCKLGVKGLLQGLYVGAFLEVAVLLFMVLCFTDYVYGSSAITYNVKFSSIEQSIPDDNDDGVEMNHKSSEMTSITEKDDDDVIESDKI